MILHKKLIFNISFASEKQKINASWEKHVLVSSFTFCFVIDKNDCAILKWSTDS